MNERIIQIRALDKKTSSLNHCKDIISPGRSWINTIREALGMTALQLAKRLNITQPRIAQMEKNEKNLKISTMEKMAKALDCEFVYYFKPKTTFQDIVENQAKKKAEEILDNVNVNMSLENQDIKPEDAITDMANDLIQNKTKLIWD